MADVPPLAATVVIPTYNGERYLARILEALRGQVLDGEYDVLVIDSGSTDKTLEIVRSFPEVRLREIPNEEFGHGRTRNLGAQLSRGRFTAYLTHDAIPLSSDWLRRLIEPMLADAAIVAVMGKQIPRAGCFPLLKYEIRGVFANAGVDHGVTVYSGEWAGDSAGGRERASFYSDVNSAARTSLLLTQIPYREVPYAEDQLFGHDVLNHGLKKAYAPLAAVEHSNDLTLRAYGKRIFDETVGRREREDSVPRVSFVGARLRMLRGALGDQLRILRDPDYRAAAKCYWWLVNPWYHVRKWSSYRRATRIDLSDVARLRKYSLEAATRHGSGD